MTRDNLKKIQSCSHLLEAPAPQVVGELVDELLRYIDAIDAVYNDNSVGRELVVKHFGTTH